MSTRILPLMQRFGPVLIIGLALVCFVWMVKSVWVYVLDDSFITFRYAHNLAGGGGFVWNLGGPPIEGFTSFLWVILLAPFAKSDLLLTSRAMSIAAVLLTSAVCFYAVYEGSRAASLNKTPRFFLGSVVVLILIFNAQMSRHAVSGMETGVAMLLITSFFVLATFFLQHPTRTRGLILGFLALAAGLARPEANLAIGTCLLAALFATKDRRMLFVYSFFPYLFFGCVYFFWRFSYFGLMFPLPFYVKQVSPLELAGLNDVLRFLASLWPLYVFWAIFLWSLRDLYSHWLPVALGVVTWLGYFILPEHIMGVGYRYLYPVYPILVVFAGLGMSALIRDWQERVSMAVGLIMVLCILSAIWQLFRFEIVVRDAVSYGNGLRDAHVTLGETLARIDPYGGKLLAIGDAGAVPYYSNWQTLDTFGLNDRTIALNVRASYDTKYVTTKNPALLVLISKNQTMFDSPLQHESLLYAECLTEGYLKAGSVRFGQDYYLWLMVKDESFRQILQEELIRTTGGFVP